MKNKQIKNLMVCRLKGHTLKRRYVKAGYKRLLGRKRRQKFKRILYCVTCSYEESSKRTTPNGWGMSNIHGQSMDVMIQDEFA